MAWSQPLCRLVEEIKQAQAADPVLSRVLQGEPPADTFTNKISTKGGILYVGDRLLVPKNSELITKILLELHSSPVGGHSGVKRTVARIATNFFWSGMQHDIKEFISKCDICPKAKSLNSSPAGLPQPLPIPNKI